jgi:hypothetical protein
MVWHRPYTAPDATPPTHYKSWATMWRLFVGVWEALIIPPRDTTSHVPLGGTVS